MAGKSTGFAPGTLEVVAADGLRIQCYSTGITSSSSSGASDGKCDSASEGSSSKRAAFILLHGAGHSAMSFGPMLAALADRLGQGSFIAVAPDMRGHGLTADSTPDFAGSGAGDMSLGTLVSDVEAVCDALLTPASGYHGGPVILVGHSMGGAVASHVAKRAAAAATDKGEGQGEARWSTSSSSSSSSTSSAGAAGAGAAGAAASSASSASDEERRGWRGAVVGLAVVDVVEGTALNSLQYMDKVLAARPTYFSTEDAAIEYMLTRGGLRNRATAAITVPPLLKPSAAGSSISSISSSSSSSSSSDSGGGEPDGDGFAWRVDLAATCPYWRGWFEGLNAAFLDNPKVIKLLVVAGMDRLDKETTIAQMSGRIQISIAYGCGHAVQEDDPGKFAEYLIQFAGFRGWVNMPAPTSLMDGGGGPMGLAHKLEVLRRGKDNLFG